MGGGVRMVDLRIHGDTVRRRVMRLKILGNAGVL